MDSPNNKYTLGPSKQASFDHFYNKHFCNIREYYCDIHDMKIKPSKKGITLNKQECIKLLEALPHIIQQFDK